MIGRHGVELERSTLAGWVGGAYWWLEALDDRLRKDVFASDHLFADDTPVPVLDPGRRRTKTGRLWVYARDQRPWGGPAPPAAVYICAPDRREAGGASGTLQRSAARRWLYRLRADDDTGRRRARRLLGPYKTQVL